MASFGQDGSWIATKTKHTHTYTQMPDIKKENEPPKMEKLNEKERRRKGIMTQKENGRKMSFLPSDNQKIDFYLEKLY